MITPDPVAVKRTALDRVRVATTRCATIRPRHTRQGIEYDPDQVRAAQRELTLAQMAAIDAGASRSEVEDASEWAGVVL